jgi:hypothetical protein
MSQPEGSPRYRVDCSLAVTRSLRDLRRKAFRAGLGEEFVRAFQRIIERLEMNPTELGEPLYQLPALRMQVYSAAIHPIVIHFAVRQDARLVIIKGANLLSPPT